MKSRSLPASPIGSIPSTRIAARRRRKQSGHQAHESGFTRTVRSDQAGNPSDRSFADSPSKAALLRAGKNFSDEIRGLPRSFGSSSFGTAKLLILLNFHGHRHSLPQAVIGIGYHDAEAIDEGGSQFRCLNGFRA